MRRPSKPSKTVTSKIKVFAAEPVPWGIKAVSIDVATCKAHGSGLYGIDNGPYCQIPNHPMVGRPLLRLVLQGPRGGDKGRVYFTKEQAAELISALGEMAEQVL